MDFIYTVQGRIFMQLTREDLLELLLSSCRFCVMDALNGNLEPYIYKEHSSEEFGTYDANYDNRFRLVFGLFYSPNHFPKERCESLIRTLFLEELKDLENNSFQGIGMNLELLTALLYQYHRDCDTALFESALNANFDCACGYDAKRYASLSRDLSAESKESQIYDAIELGYPDIAKELIIHWQRDIKQWNPSDIYNLHTWSKSLHDVDKQLETAKEIFEEKKQAKNEWDITSAYETYIKELIELGRFEDGYKLFLEMKPHLLHSCDKKATEWYKVGLGRFALLYGVDLILHLFTLKTEEMKALWNFLKPYLLLAFHELPHTLYQKTAEVASLMEEEEMAEKFLTAYEEFPLLSKNLS